MPGDKVTAGGEVASSTAGVDIMGRDPATDSSWQRGLRHRADAAALNLAETGQGMVASATVLTAVTGFCSSSNLTLFFLPPPSFLSPVSVGDSHEGINVLVSA